MEIPASWLFTKGQESIRVVRPDATALILEGPGQQRESRHFPDEASIQSYQMELAEQLAAGGWLLLGQNYDRRTRARGEASAPTRERRRS